MKGLSKIIGIIQDDLQPLQINECTLCTGDVYKLRAQHIGLLRPRPIRPKLDIRHIVLNNGKLSPLGALKANWPSLSR